MYFGALKELHLTDAPWEKCLFQGSCMYTDIGTLRAHFSPTSQTMQSATSHRFLLLRCATTSPHYPSSNSIKFTHLHRLIQQAA